MPNVRGKQNRNGRKRAHAGQHTDHIADQHPDEAPHDIVWLNGDSKTVPEISQCGFDHKPLHVSNCIGI
jgi:hypothetical protein